MNNVTIGGFDPIRDRPFAYYETICGGAGGGPGGPGLSAVHSHMTNTRNTPVETLESHYPLRVHHYSIADSGGGAGSSPGGRGVVRSIELLSDAAASLIGDRRNHPPPGAGGGSDGTPGGGGWGHETGGSARGIGHPLRKTVFRQE
jgi:N-methylhydantoinase B